PTHAEAGTGARAGGVSTAPHDHSPATRGARAGMGARADDGGGPLVPSPSLASVYAYGSLAALDEAMESREPYRRYGTESAQLLEDALADLETPPRGEKPVARLTASGQAALLLALSVLASPRRRRVVVVRPCYGGTDALIAGPLGNLGMQLTTVDVTAPNVDHAAAVRDVVGDDVCAVVAEVITNPLMQVINVPQIIAVAHDAGVPCIVDSTFTPPFLFQPFAYGADVVFHSLTKHLSGHSDVLGGIVLITRQHQGADWLDGFSRLLGAALGPFDAWLCLRGLRTAALRIERGSSIAASLASWFAQDGRVRAVHYPGTHGDAEEACARELLPHGRGPMLSIELNGGRQAVDAFTRRLQGVRLAPSLGDVATTVSHPALTSHRSLSREQRQLLGISDGIVRVSTGIEALEDLQDEFDQALG
ncbi:MAG: PLP-dependent aspartate aminotransferase family protein, partial [Candidatus Dormibacteria bacterium]